MIKVLVNSGACGFNTIIKGDSQDGQNATIQFETQCPNLKPMEELLKEVDSFKECFSKLGESPTFELLKQYCKHPTCSVPSAVLKCIEAACGLALPKDVEIKISKENAQ